LATLDQDNTDSEGNEEEYEALLNNKEVKDKIYSSSSSDEEIEIKEKVLSSSSEEESEESSDNELIDWKIPSCPKKEIFRTPKVAETLPELKSINFMSSEGMMHASSP